jgi:hypothetical protein
MKSYLILLLLASTSKNIKNFQSFDWFFSFSFVWRVKPDFEVIAASRQVSSKCLNIEG